VDINVEDQAGFMKYVGQITDLIAKHDGKYLVRGATPEALLADSDSPQLVVVIAFSSKDSADGFFAERTELGLADLFKSSTRSRILMTEGVEETDA
jgi:uncharacterized protein (DUF1330 family)